MLKYMYLLIYKESNFEYNKFFETSGNPNKGGKHDTFAVRYHLCFV
jgi:hypothetical protein